MIDGEKTLLPLVHFDGAHSWDDLWKLCAPFVENHGASMLRARLDGIVKAVAVERHYIDRDYRDTFSHYHSKRFSTPDSRVLRLHFFDRAVTREELLEEEVAQAPYCGYSVIRPTRPSCLGRTMLSPLKILGLKGCLLKTCREEITLQRTRLQVEAFPFISQDTDATVCAQSALWMLFRYFSTKYAHYREIRPFEITQLTKDYSVGRLFPTNGLYIWQMGEACRQAGFSPLIYTRGGFPAEFEHLLYTYIESGVPVLAATEGHVFVALGHFSDFTKLVPAQARTPSSFFNRGFVINDDNCMPYQRLQMCGQAAAVSPADSIHCVDQLKSFIAPLPEKVFLAAEHHQKLVDRLLNHPVFGIDANSPSLSGCELVTRSFLTSGRSFKRALRLRGMGSRQVEELYAALPMPRFVWVAELSVVGKFPHEILGEILWDATRNEHEIDGWIAVHYPEFLAIDAGSALNHLPAVKKTKLDIGSPYSPYATNLKWIK
jgi:hypothetical protein